VHISRHDKVAPGAERIDRLVGYRELGVSRTIEFLPASARDDDALASYADDMAQAGCDRDVLGDPSAAEARLESART
jgi:hypothetical protein